MSYGAAREILKQALEHDKQFRAALKEKGPIDSTVRLLSISARDRYQALVLEHPEFAEANDVEKALWRLHYMQIDDYRIRLRMAISAALAPAVPMPGHQPVQSKEAVLFKLSAAVKSFLSDATGFYHDLISKIQAKYGFPDMLVDFHVRQVVADAASLENWEMSCHRCLIYLGDLARYKELLCWSAGPGSYDWSVASGYYLKAALLWPSSGNPHNQLAVLATYVGDELLAVYFYARSLAVQFPFLTARDNLILLFEKNRQQYAELQAATATPGVKADVIVSLGTDAMMRLRRSKDSSSETLAQTRKRFRRRFVRLNGILFTKTSLETFAEVYLGTVRDLEQLLNTHDSRLDSGLGSEHRSGIGTGSGGAAGVLQLVCVLIFSVHNIIYGPQPSSGELLQHAFAAAFELCGRLTRRCTESKDPTTSPLLPAVLVFLEWLACRPETAVASQVNERHEGARKFFLGQLLTLLNILGELELDALPIEFSNCDATGASALWEDYELRGFVPLEPAHAALVYTSTPAPPGSSDIRPRVQRLIAAGKAVSNAFQCIDQGLHFDGELGRFMSPTRVPQTEAAHEAVEAETLDRGELDTEEEDEVIVFQPASRPPNCLTADKPVTVAEAKLPSNGLQLRTITSENVSLPCASNHISLERMRSSGKPAIFRASASLRPQESAGIAANQDFDELDQQPVDDYRWLDEDTPAAHPEQSHVGPTAGSRPFLCPLPGTGFPKQQVASIW